MNYKHYQTLNDLEAAKLLGLKVQTLRNWRSQRKGPAYIKMSRRVVYMMKDLEEYLERNRIVPEGNFNY